MAPAVVAIVGPTACGKSALALDLARKRNGEIVSCDSVQVYKGFNIGSAKPTVEEQKTVRHHCIDVVEWHEEFHAEHYRQYASKALNEIAHHDKQAIIVGGTGLYLRALRYGLIPTPKPNPTLRTELYAKEAAEPGELYRRLVTIDPGCAKITGSTNIVRLVRALEIYAATQRRPSELFSAHGFRTEKVAMQVFVLTWPDDVLQARIQARTETMLAQGLLGEVENLLAQGVSPKARPMGAVGYKECCAVLTGQLAATDLAQVIQRSTWNYVRRQRTWFKKEKNVRFVVGDNPEQFLRKILENVLS